MEPAEAFAAFLMYVISAVIIGPLAARKNRNGWAWALIGGLALGLGLLVLAFMPWLCPKCHQSISNKQWKQRTCPRCGDIKTVSKRAGYAAVVPRCDRCGKPYPSKYWLKLFTTPEGVTAMCNACYEALAVPEREALGPPVQNEGGT